MVFSVVEGLVNSFSTRDPFMICRCLGIEVICFPLIDVRGYTIVEDGVSIICLSDNLDDFTSKFVCAHELGHAVMHKGMNRIFMDCNTFFCHGRYEAEADAFAVHLLFHDEEEFYESGINAEAMANALRTSIYNVQARLYELQGK